METAAGQEEEDRRREIKSGVLDICTILRGACLCPGWGGEGVRSAPPRNRADRRRAPHLHRHVERRGLRRALLQGRRCGRPLPAESTASARPRSTTELDQDGPRRSGQRRGGLASVHAGGVKQRVSFGAALPPCGCNPRRPEKSPGVVGLGMSMSWILRLVLLVYYYN